MFVSLARENLREFLFHKIRTLELTNIEFHEHVEVVDLSTCSIDLQPENLPTKRIWSKKYPIRIRPNTRKPYSTQEATKKMAAKKDIKDEAELDLDKEPEDDEVRYGLCATLARIPIWTETLWPGHFGLRHFGLRPFGLRPFGQGHFG